MKRVTIEMEDKGHNFRLGKIAKVYAETMDTQEGTVVNVEDVQEPTPLKPCPSGHESPYVGECANGSVGCGICGWRAESRHLWNRRV